jgi:type IV fimbrial biogenesis protein FimT
LSRKDPDCDFKGFTLIELLIALTIVIILALVAIPTFRDLYIRYSLSTTAQRLQYLLQYARSEAIKNNATIHTVFQTGTNWCYGINSGATCNCSVANNCALGAEGAPLLQDIQLTTTGMTGNSIQFEGTHGATNVATSVTFTQSGTSTAITLKIGALGNMQLCSATISGYPTCT